MLRRLSATFGKSVLREPRFFCAAVRERLDELKNEPTQLTDEATDRQADEAPTRPRQVPDKHGPR